ncbi:MAG: hypothetical protein FJ190_12195 [Gammaproteobacteria bacterium]|nr:hypothetical protein [Gammaproteobacteria bacterium]
MLDLNKDELHSLHRYIFETKFSEDAQDMAFSKHVSQIANKVLDKIISKAEKDCPDKALSWEKWGVLTKERREWEIIKRKIIQDKYWHILDKNEKIEHLRMLSSPLIINDEAINEFILELNSP